MKQVSSFEHNKNNIEAWEGRPPNALFIITVNRWHPEDELCSRGGRSVERPWAYQVDACNQTGIATADVPWLEAEGFATKTDAYDAGKKALEAQCKAVLTAESGPAKKAVEVITAKDIDKALGRDVVVKRNIASQFTHDCRSCNLLGHVRYADQDDTLISVDLYHCASVTMGGTLIARYGDAGAEYASFPVEIVEERLATDPTSWGTWTSALPVALFLLRLKENGPTADNVCKLCGDSTLPYQEFCGASCCAEYERASS